jgi:exonuclease SbcC
VLDELVGRGRTVGIVTHVPELAERMPVRFEVTKGPETSSVARVGE